MCGIVGIVGRSPVNQQLYDALTVLQHRGQDAAGIMTADGGELFASKGSGLVRDVFSQRDMESLRGNFGIAHVRYPTAGGNSASEVQPFYVNAPFGICLGHQILAHDNGGKTYKLKFGHHGANHPVKDLLTNKVEITSQNHGFCVDIDSLPSTAQITHMNLNDNTVEGFQDEDRGFFCVQYHPEAAPGPHDSAYLFRRFREWIAARRG